MAFHLVGKAGIIVEIFAHVANLRPHFGGELAVVAALDVGEVVGVGDDQIGHFPQQGTAGARRKFRPWSLAKGAPGRGDGMVDIGGGAARHPRPDLAAIGILGVEGAAVDRGSGDAVDEMRIYGKRRFAHSATLIGNPLRRRALPPPQWRGKQATGQEGARKAMIRSWPESRR